MAEEKTVTLVIDGEERTMSEEVYQQIVRGENWERTLTHKSENVASRERQLNQERENLLAQGSNSEDEEEEEVAQDVDDINLPSALDDPEGHNRAVKEQIKAAEERALKRAKSELRAEVENEVQGGIAHNNARQTAFQANKDLIDEYVQEQADAGKPFTAKQKDEMVSFMDTQLRLPKKGLCERDASGVIVFKKQALELADKATRADFHLAREREEGVREGLTRAGSVEHADLSGMAGTAPERTASTREKVEFALSLPMDSQAQADYIDGLTDEELNEFLVTQHQMELNERTVGSV